MSQPHIVLYRDLWAQIMGALDPGTDLYAAVLKIAPVTWDGDLTPDPATDRDLRQLAVEFPQWHIWRPPSPDGGQPWWGARDGHTVIITGTGAELRAALAHRREGTSPPGAIEAFPLHRTAQGLAIVTDPGAHFPGWHIAGTGATWSAVRDWGERVVMVHTGCPQELRAALREFPDLPERGP
jgi:hypothetical protein